MQNCAVNWGEVFTIADKHYVLPLLYFMLVKKDLLDKLPDNLQELLFTVYELNGQRNNKLKQQTLEIVKQLNSIEVIPVLLKGATALFSNLYPNPACRLMGDLDILVPADRIEECVLVLKEDGYLAMEKELEYRKHHHWVPLSRPGRIGAVELHREIAAAPVTQLLNANTICEKAILMQCKGTQFQLCSNTHLAIHNILHHQLAGIINMYNRRSFSLYQVYDLVQLMQLPANSIAWDELINHFKQHGYSKETTLYFIMINKLFHQPLPTGISKFSILRGDYLLMRSQVKFPVIRYYFQIFWHLLKYKKQRKLFASQLISLKSYKQHFKRLSIYLSRSRKK
jgi:hypothetical protein